MLSTDCTFDGFAGPSQPLNEFTFGYVLIEHAYEVVKHVLRSEECAIRRREPSLWSYVNDWLGNEENWENVWCRVFGDAYASLVTERIFRTDEVLANLALHLIAAGHEGKWQVTFDQPASLCFDRWMIAVERSLAVWSQGGVVTIETLGVNCESFTFSRSNGEWQTERRPTVFCLREHGVRAAIVNEDFLGEGASLSLKHNQSFSHEHLDANVDLMVKTARDALALIRCYAPPFLPWISRVLREILPLPYISARAYQSASNNLSPGLVSATNQRFRRPLAEALVHECTHQYFYILSRVGPIDDGSDSTLYYSPFRDMGRPIRFIVMAYHAFGNVLLFYRMAVANGLSKREVGIMPIEDALLSLERDLKTLEKALFLTKALTPVGRALWEPLYKDLHL